MADDALSSSTFDASAAALSGALFAIEVWRLVMELEHGNLAEV